MLIRIGITGGIGSGKSEVCEIFSALGIRTISADAIARQLTDSDPVIKKKLIARFGSEAFHADSGLLNREYIAGIVFEDRLELNALNSIVHPAVIAAIDTTVRSFEAKKDSGYTIVEAALLFESRLNKKVDYILSVVADEALRIARVKKRDTISEDQIRLRIANQYPVDKAIDASDFVLYNNDSVAALHDKIKFLHTVFSTLKPRLKNKP